MAYRDTILADAPTGYYRLGENAGTVAGDSSGNGANGTYENGPTLNAAALITGDNDKAVTFAGGSAQDVLLPTDAISLASATAQISIESWFKTSTTGVPIITARKSSDGNPLLTVRISSGILLFQVRANDGSGLINTTFGLQTLNDNTRHHLVVTRNASKVWRFYLDGVVLDRAVDTMGAGITGMDWCYIARDRADPDFYTGTIDEVAIYKGICLTPAQVAQHWTDGSQEPTSATGDSYSSTVLADTPSAYWRFGESAGTIRAVDKSGNGNHGARRNGATAGSTGLLTNLSDFATVLDGSNDHIQIPEDVLTLTSATQSFSIELLEKSNQGAITDDVIVDLRTTDTQGLIQIGTASGAVRAQGRNSDGSNLLRLDAASPSILDNIRHHIVVTRDGSDKKWRIYVDGNLVATSSADSLTNTGVLARSIFGRATSGGTIFAGTLDEVAFYPYALSLSQVQAHYNALSGVRQPRHPAINFQDPALV